MYFIKVLFICEISCLCRHDEELCDETRESLIRLSVDYSRRALTIDKTSRIVFPITFFLFNCIYWCIYYFFDSEVYGAMPTGCFASKL